MSIIVIFGLPGSGKTTCIQELIKNRDKLPVALLSRKDFEEWAKGQSPIKKFFMVLSNAETYLRILIPYLKIALYNIYCGLEFWKRIFQSPIYFIYMHYFMKSRKETYLSDHGSVQELWSIVVRSKSIPDQYLHEVIDSWRNQFAFRYIYFQIDPSVAAKRIVYRKVGKSLFDGKLFPQIQDDLINAHNSYEHIANLIETSGIKVHHLKNESDLSTAAHDFKEFVLAKP